MHPILAASLGFGLGLLVGIGLTVWIVRRIAAMGRETRLAMELQAAKIQQAEREAAWEGWQEKVDQPERRADWN